MPLYLFVSPFISLIIIPHQQKQQTISNLAMTGANIQESAQKLPPTYSVLALGKTAIEIMGQAYGESTQKLDRVVLEQGEWIRCILNARASETAPVLVPTG